MSTTEDTLEPTSLLPKQRAARAEDRTGAPYFYIESEPGAEGAAIEAMPLLSTAAEITISGMIARVLLTQTYKNEGEKPIEAVYVFPASTRAALFSMKMTLGARTIVAQIQKKAEARATYEAAKAEGKTASLLEQQRPNVFQMNVANILPGDVIQVEMAYVEQLTLRESVYELVYPAVVGPRYVGETEAPEDFTATPHLKEGQDGPYTWALSVKLNAGLPVQAIASPSHTLTLARPEPGTVRIGLVDEAGAGTRDFVLQYRLAGEEVQSALLVQPPTDALPGYFLAMLQPPVEVAVQDVPRREYVFILDVSGSMHGYPLDLAKRVMAALLADMNETDYFNILCFSMGNKRLSDEPLPVTKSTRARAQKFMASMLGGGSTELIGALQQAFEAPEKPGYARTYVALTDGFVPVEAQAFRLIRERLAGAAFFSIGIGWSVNRELIEGMARAGMGEPLFVMGEDDVQAQALALQRLLARPALTDVQVAFEGFNAFAVEPAAIPVLFSGRPILVFGKYRGDLQGEVRFTGVRGRGAFSASLLLSEAQVSDDNEALRYLWARHNIRTLSDLHALGAEAGLEEAITQLGLDYHLMTAFTSFVAVDTEVRSEGEAVTVKQPLPLPAGVSEAALGGRVQGMRHAMSAAPAIRVRSPRPKRGSGPSGTLVESYAPDELVESEAPGELGAPSPLSSPPQDLVALIEEVQRTAPGEPRASVWLWLLPLLVALLLGAWWLW